MPSLQRLLGHLDDSLADLERAMGTAVKKAPVKKAPVKKAPVKKAPVKKGAVKKAASAPKRSRGR